jgi:hypothetical protein
MPNLRILSQGIVLSTFNALPAVLYMPNINSFAKFTGLGEREISWDCLRTEFVFGSTYEKRQMSLLALWLQERNAKRAMAQCAERLVLY